tara:strand:+ start:270 stop:389 length:120 start_codon:yes stop_codon:yes gene_type:complete
MVLDSINTYSATERRVTYAYYFIKFIIKVSNLPYKLNIK